MQTVVLVIRRKPIAQALTQKLRAAAAQVLVIYEPDYAQADVAIRTHSADIALIEAAECGEYDTEHCLALCTWLQKETPYCKRILMCPEQDDENVAHAVEAKRSGRIDDFVFYDSSIEYLVSKLLSMQDET